MASLLLRKVLLTERFGDAGILNKEEMLGGEAGVGKCKGALHEPVNKKKRLSLVDSLCKEPFNA